MIPEPPATAPGERPVPDTPGAADELWFATPPGWIELVAFPDDETASAWFDGLLDQTPELRDEAGPLLREAYRTARAEAAGTPVDSAGAIVTLVDGDEGADGPDRVTVWQYSVRLLLLPPAQGIDLMTVVERFLASPAGRRGLEHADDLVESFTTPDGRSGIAVHATAAADDPERLRQHLPHAAPDRLGTVVAATRFPHVAGDPRERVLLVSGICPRPEERTAMSLVAAHIVASARLRGADDAPLPGRIDVDATGRGRHAAAAPGTSAGGAG